MVDINDEDYEKIGELSGRVLIRMMNLGEENMDEMMTVFIEEGFKQMGYKLPKVGSIIDKLTMAQTSKILVRVMEMNDLDELFPSNEPELEGDATE